MLCCLVLLGVAWCCLVLLQVKRQAWLLQVKNQSKHAPTLSLFLSGIQCEGTLELGAQTSNLRPGTNCIELMLQTSDGEDGQDRLQHLNTPPPETVPERGGNTHTHAHVHMHTHTHEHMHTHGGGTKTVGAETGGQGALDAREDEGPAGVARVTFTLLHAIDIQAETVRVTSF